MTRTNPDAQLKRAYYRARADNIKRQVSVYDVLNHYRIAIRTENAEVQYPCPLHGDGRDMGYSARAYPEEEGSPGGSTFCWGCQKSRDVIQWVMDKESLSFTQAMGFLEGNFGVQGIPNIYQYFDPAAISHNKNDAGLKESQLSRELREILEGTQQGGDKDKQLHPLISQIDVLERKIDRRVSTPDPLTRKSLSMDAILRAYFVLDTLRHDLLQGDMGAGEASLTLQKLTDKVTQMLR